MQQQIASSLDEATRRALAAVGHGSADGVHLDTGPRDGPSSLASAIPNQPGSTASRQRPRTADPTPSSPRGAATSISISAARRMALAAARQRAAGLDREERAGLQRPAQGPKAEAPTRRTEPRPPASATLSPARATPSAPRAATAPPQGARGSDRRDSVRRAREPASAAPGPSPRRPVAALPEHIRRLPEPLRHDPRTFRATVQRMDPDERHALSAEIRRELIVVTRGRYASDAREAAEKQARFLLAVLAGRTVTPPAAPKKPTKKSARSGRAKKPAMEEKSAPRFRSVRAYAPSPSKYLLPARGIPVSGGLPSLGRRG